MTTNMIYLETPDLYDSTATVNSVEPDLEGGLTVILDQTIFYPQGGGQPTDKGNIKSATANFEVSRVAFADGEVLHKGKLVEGELAKGDDVSLAVDRELREHHARLHTGGHLIMTAVDRLLSLPATKGYHFPDGPYVEFIAIVPVERRAAFIGEIQQQLDQMIAEDSDVTWAFDSVDKLRDQGVYIPMEIPAGKPTRVVTTAGYRSPCGGTHVRRLGMLQGLTARGIKVKSGNTRVSYQID